MAKVKLDVPIELEDYASSIPPPYREGMFEKDVSGDGDFAVYGTSIPRNLSLFIIRKGGQTRVLQMTEVTLKSIIQSLLK